MGERIIVKIGSSSLTSDQGGLNQERIRFFADELSALHKAGYEVLLVTSGAIAAGFRKIGYETRPKLVHEKQAAAAVGQALLMQAYQEAFGLNSIGVAQILLTRSDFSNRKRIHNALATLNELLSCNILPIINENDTVAVAEIKFGDNDTLSSLVANLVKAKQLIILTDTDGSIPLIHGRTPKQDASNGWIKFLRILNALRAEQAQASVQAECDPKLMRPELPCAAAFPLLSENCRAGAACLKLLTDMDTALILIRSNIICL